MAEFRKAHQFIVFCVHHPSQLALADFMAEAPPFADELTAFYQVKRDFFRARVARLALPPAALRRHLLQLACYDGVSNLPDTEFVQHLLRERRAWRRFRSRC